MSYNDQQISELRQRVALLERQVAFLMEQLGVEYYEEPNAGVPPEILDLVRQGRKIEAIKLYRQETGVGLREAKEFVDALE
jgi:large subunit ribosomal protein L7/L12